jgi:hypothetical protein
MMDIANIFVIRSILATRSLRGTSQRVRGPRMASEWAAEAWLPMKLLPVKRSDEALPLVFSCGFYTTHCRGGPTVTGTPSSPRSKSGFTAAHSSTLDRRIGDGWIAAGDASMTFDPLS